MASVINTNIASLNSQRNLLTTQNALSTSIQRLSSGLRINSAKDDAAGLAISERFSSQIRGLNQATRNANDGISLTQTAEGAMSQISDNLQRVRELSVQSANATNSKTDREAMQKEVTALLAEIDRVAGQTEFNGTKLLDGSFSGQQIQVGANAGQTIGISSILDAKTASLGQVKFDTAVLAGVANTGTTDKVVDDMKITGTDGKEITLDSFTIKAGATAAEAATAITTAINAKMDQTGVYAEVDATTASNINLTAIKSSVTDTGTFNAIKVAASTKAGTAAVTGSTAVTASTVKSLSASTVDIKTVAGAQQALTIADKALSAVNSARADMGAIQNRFSSVIANLQSSTENLSASQSRIRDTDYASETAQLTRNQILQQAGTAMLAQANSLPQSVLSLLG